MNDRGEYRSCAYGLLALLVLSLLPAVQGCRRAAPSAPAESANPGLGGMIAAAEAFRREASREPSKALVSHCSPEAAVELRSIGKQLGSAVGLDDPEMLLRWFFQASSLSFVAPDQTIQLAAFYHPWSDLMLLTEWRRQETGANPLMHRAIVVPGDLVRRPGTPETIEPLPPWRLREDLPPQLPLLFTARESVEAFLDRFDVPEPSDYRVPWEQKLPLRDDKIAARVREATILRAGSNLFGLLNLRQSAEDAGLRKRFDAVLRQLRDGGIAALNPAPTEPGGSFPPGTAHDAFYWKEVRPVASVAGRGGRVFLFVASPRTPAEFACLWFRLGSDRSFSLEKIECYSLNITAETLETIRANLSRNGILL